MQKRSAGVTTSLRIPPEMLEALRKQADVERRTMSAIVIWAIDNYLAEVQKPKAARKR